jgi:glycosyltransferase involved in cell wall biosynthesis
MYKDVTTIEHAVRKITARRPDTELLCVCVGANKGSAPDAQFYSTGYLADPRQIALYYQAADVLLHAAKIENFPCVILEALACGTPVIATAVGGIPEQIVEGITGFLVPGGDSDAMVHQITNLIDHPEECQRMGQAAALYVQQHFSLERQVASYLQWFEECQGDCRF